MNNHPEAEPSTSPKTEAPAEALLQPLLDSGWTPADNSARLLRAAEGAGLTLRLPTTADECLVLEAEPRRRGDGGIQPAWRVEVCWWLPVAALAAVAAAHADPSDPATELADLLVPAGWNRSELRHRDWHGPERELQYVDGDPEGSGTWCIQRWDLEVGEDYIDATGDCGIAIAASADTPANVIAALAIVGHC